MPKRVIDGEGIWRSDTLLKVTPPKFRAEYANLIPLALANGVFEAESRKVWSQVYSFNRPDVSVKIVEDILNEFERVSLLVRWDDGHGKIWGYWVGIDKPGRLPPPARRGVNERIGPAPPKELIDRIKPFSGYVYIAESKSGNIKIGFSTMPQGRIEQLTYERDEPVSLLTTVKGTFGDETTIHRILSAEKKERGREWYTKSERVGKYVKSVVDTGCIHVDESCIHADAVRCLGFGLGLGLGNGLGFGTGVGEDSTKNPTSLKEKFEGFIKQQKK